jgi:type II secretory pathway component GspD/PulD (secretin)
VNSLILAVILLSWSNTLFAADEGPVVVEPRFRVFALKHISTEQAKNILAEAELGTVSQLPADSMILVTGQPRQLIKASAVLKLFDAETPVVMKAILPASAAGNLPSNEQIAAEIGNMSIGSFSNPPGGVGMDEAIDKAIIDVHDDSVVVIATAEKLAAINEALGISDSKGSIKQLQKEENDVPEPEQPKIAPVADTELERVKAELGGRNGSYVSTQVKADTNEPETSGLFDKLLDSLDDAEKKIAEMSPPAPNVPEPEKSPIQPDTGITVPEKVEPNEPSTALKQPVEAVKEVTKEAVKEVTKEAVKEVTKEAVKEVEKPNVTAVRKKPVAKKIATKLTSKREPNDVPEKVTVEVEEPNQVAPILQDEPNAVTEVVEPNTATKVIKPTIANGPYQPELTTMGDDKLELVMPEKINIIALLDLVGKYLNLNYMYDPVDLTGLKGEVTLVLQGPIKIKELYPLAESVLRFKKYVMTRRGNLVTIVPETKVFDIDAPIVDPNNPEVQAGDVIITRIFELKHIETASAQSLLSAMKLGVSVSPIASIRTLIVTGYAYRMERIESLLDMIDKPGEQKEFRFRGLKFTTASTLATKVKTLAEQLGTVSITISVPTTTTPARPTVPGRRTPTPPRTPTRPTIPSPTAAPAKPTVYLDADERTNRILMIGLEEQLSIVEKLIETLDVEKQDLRTLRLYEIQHVDAEDVRTKLSELGIISAGAGRGAATSSRAPARTPTVAGRPPTSSRTPTSRLTTPSTTGAIQDPLAEEPQIVIIEPTNSLLVNGTTEQHIQIAIIIGYVDAEQEVDSKQNPYVIYPLENQDPEELAGVLEKLISETITEQTGTDATKLVKTTQKKKKIEDDIFIVPDPKTYSLIVYASKKNQLWLSSLIEDLDQYRPQVLLDCTLVEVFKNDEFNITMNWLQSFPDLTEVSSKAFDPLSVVLPETKNRFIEISSAGNAFYGDDHINFLLSATQTRNYGRVLARPKILVNDNEIGTIKTEETQYIVRVESNVVAGAGVGTSTTRSSVNFESYNAGITLEIEPHISKGDQLRLKISMIRTDFRETAAAKVTDPETGAVREIEKPPDTVSSDIQTIVTVPDSYTIILGGLEKLTQSKGGSKIPILGDLPILGGLFRNTSNDDQQVRLYVFVKAHILRPEDVFDGDSTMEVVSRKNRATFEKYEKEMQEYEDWPGIKPTPMDPLQILEADESVSLRNQRVFEKRGPARREGGNLPDTKSKAMHMGQVLELN